MTSICLTNEKTNLWYRFELLFFLPKDDIPVNASFVPTASIPGMGPDDKVDTEPEPKGPETIPGLDFDTLSFDR